MKEQKKSEKEMLEEAGLDKSMCESEEAARTLRRLIIGYMKDLYLERQAHCRK